MFRPARRLDVSALFRVVGAGLILLAASCSASSANRGESTGGSGVGGSASSSNGTGAGGGGMLGGGAGGSASSGGTATGGTGTAGRTGGNGTGGGVSQDAGITDALSGEPHPPTDGGPGSLGGGPVTTSITHFDIGVHDPSMIWDGSKYYLFRTNNLGIRSSTSLTDSTQWAASNLPTFLPGIPTWVATAVPGVRGLWAPDISHFNGKFHVYYAGSTFGSFTSVIGLATNATLESTRPDYAWIDEGLIVQTRDRIDSYNAIDPNVAFDATGAPWLSFGSFGSGIKLHKLDATTGKFATDDPTLYSIASRNGVANGAVEAPSIISHNGYFYLFVSFDVCCQGLSSTYRTMAGRASAITGPYADSMGKPMLDSGGDELIATTGRYIGPGGGTAWKDGDNYLYVYHYYDGMTPNGASKLLIRPITFTADDWIVLGAPLFP